MSASFQVSLLLAWLRLYQDQATCAQPEALAHTNLPTVTKKSYVTVLTFNPLNPGFFDHSAFNPSLQGNDGTPAYRVMTVDPKAG